VPSEHPEGIIQFALKAGLLNAFPLCDVREEEPNIEGRLDLRIVEPHPDDRAVATPHAVLELKVLRSFWASGTAVSGNDAANRVKEGVDQAFAYRKGATYSILCCFDMRKDDTGDTCFDAIREYATKLEVSLRRWFIYASARAYRAALAAAKVG
jgi:hypothetical protein